jgi:transposase-like protein
MTSTGILPPAADEQTFLSGHFPNDAAALKCLYLVTRSLDPTGQGRARWATRWKPALNAFAIRMLADLPSFLPGPFLLICVKL